MVLLTRAATFLRVDLKMSDHEKSPQPDAVLLDDDVFVRESWRIHGEDNGLALRIFESADALLAAVATIDKGVPIFLDVELGRGRGEEVARQLFAQGYRELYLATGYAPKDLKLQPGIKGVIGKTPPDWLKKGPRRGP